MLRYKFQRAMLITAIMAVVLIPGIVVASGLTGIRMLAQIPGVETAADQLGSKNLAYWFLTLAAVAIGSWTWIVKWLIRQLESQRKSNTEQTSQMFEYMKTERAQMLVLMDRFAKVMEVAVQKLDGAKHTPSNTIV